MSKFMEKLFLYLSAIAASAHALAELTGQSGGTLIYSALFCILVAVYYKMEDAK